MPPTAAMVAEFTWSVPVDMFEITNGPSAVKITEAQSYLQMPFDHPQKRSPYFSLDFTLKTGASELTFRRPLLMATIFDVKDGQFSFTAIFGGKVVSGVYNMKLRTGWFNLE